MFERRVTRQIHTVLRRLERYRFSAVEGAVGAGGGVFSAGRPSYPSPPVNINTGTRCPRSPRKIDIGRGEITTLNIYETLLSGA
ncbi:unnamed protein product, partial [Iphiclides podalirius]